jgi:hypothetical protein
MPEHDRSVILDVLAEQNPSGEWRDQRGELRLAPLDRERP